MIPPLNNFLNNGTVLPSGLLEASENLSEGFNKTYKNTALRVGIITDTYDLSSDQNVSKILVEYNVLVIEQNEDKGSTIIPYRNCIAASSFGSIADFFEAKLRKLEKKTTEGITPTFSGQNGSIVLLLCLNGFSDTGIIVGALSHPDRKTTLKDEGLHLEGEYNGINIQVNDDGSSLLTFKGATDNDGKPKDSSLGTTEISIEKDGSVQFKHKTITQRLDKNGDVSLNTTGNITNSAKQKYSLDAILGISQKTNASYNIESMNLAMKASGTASLNCQHLDIKSGLGCNLNGNMIKMEAEVLANIKAPNVIIDGFVSLGGAGGVPVLLLNSIMLGVGNLGMPVLSNPIAGFALKVLGQ